MSHGPYGSDISPTITTTACNFGEVAVGLRTTAGTASTFVALTYVAFVCAVPSYSVRVFADANYGGKSWTYTCDPLKGQLLLDYASPTYPFDNDVASSVITGAGVTAYLYADFINTANAVPIEVKQSTSVPQLSPNNVASSMKLTCAYYHCPSGSVISAISLRAGAGLDFVTSLKCSNGVTYPVEVGNPDGGGPTDGIAGPWTSYTSGFFGSIGGTAGLYFTNNGVNTATYGSNYGSRTTYACPSGLYLSGLAVSPIPYSGTYVALIESATCAAAPTIAPSAAPITVMPTSTPTSPATSSLTTVSCGSGMYITSVDLFASTSVNGVASFTCSNSVTMHVSS